eukprot:PhF_6_TR11733/c1_g1_i3/m.19160
MHKITRLHSETFSVLDYYAGVNHFWIEKLIIVASFSQYLALIWAWRLNLPVYFLRRSQSIMYALFDIWTTHNNVSPAVPPYSHTFAHDVALASGVLTLYLFFLYLTSHLLHRSFFGNLERVLYYLFRLIYLPVLYHGVRFAMFDFPYNMDVNVSFQAAGLAAIRALVFGVVWGF